MTKHDIKGKRIGVVGIGVEGFVSAAYLHKLGGIVTVLDQKPVEAVPQETRTHLQSLDIATIFGEDYRSHLREFDIIVRSPGIRMEAEERKALTDKGISVTSQTQLFLEFCPAKVIGVTGTKGKGTTSTLITKMLQEAGKDVYLGGNIGVPPFTFLDALKKSSVVVLEMSSFQLMDVTISPHIAVMLMVVPEHLDFHATVEDYINAKRNILRFQTPDDIAILNRDYVMTNESDIYTDGKVLYISREREVDDGAYLKDTAVWIRTGTKDQKVIDFEDIALMGKHNLENILPAVLVAHRLGVTPEEMRMVLSTFSGLEHRLELVREVNGVKYYDDSFSTTPETAIAAIESFDGPEILILGGSSKSSNFTELGSVISKKQNIKAIIGIGQEWPKIKEKLANSTQQIVLIEGAKDMETVVKAASKIATRGDVVLLSPACASFDMFKDYKDRGVQFKEAVNMLVN